jgi:DNA-binding NtrC family response regulator
MKIRILIIDDEPKWMQFARDDLGATFEVEVAIDLKTALAKLKENRYELIIASSRRLDVLEAIRKEYPQKRIVVATGQPTTREAISMYRLGVLDYFAKDFRREVVTQKIYEAIQKPVKTPTA